MPALAAILTILIGLLFLWRSRGPREALLPGRRGGLIVTILGESGARILYGVVGLAGVIMGLLILINLAAS
jgi:hypothetical protein